MEEKKHCKWYNDEFCTNGDSPCVADYCPVAEYPELCKYKECEKNEETNIPYFVIRDKKTGLYFRGKGVNRWGKYFNQATIYRVEGSAIASIRDIRYTGGEEVELVPIQIKEMYSDE